MNVVNIVIGFIIGLLIIAIILFTILAASSNIANSPSLDVVQPTAGFASQTTTNMNATGWQILTTLGKDNCAATLTSVVNSTGGQSINSGNYTIQGCFINASTANPFNNTAWNITGNYVFTSDDEATSVLGNLSNASASFATNFTLWLSILGVVILITIIALLLFYVRRFSSTEVSSSGDGSSGDFVS